MALVGQPQSSIEIWDPGIYPAWIEVGPPSDHEAMSSFEGRAPSLRLKFHLHLERGEGAQAETTDLWHYTNATLSTHKLATFRPLVKAVFPDLNLDDPNCQVDSTSLHGNWVRVLIGLSADEAKNVVEKVLPLYDTPRKAAAPVAPAARPAASVAGRQGPPPAARPSAPVVRPPLRTVPMAVAARPAAAPVPPPGFDGADDAEIPF